MRTTSKSIETKNYSLFKFRKDNRDGGIKKYHVDRLKDSISTRNLLEFRPILVNSEYEIIDGQHRWQAAKELGVSLWYVMDTESIYEDIVHLSINREWRLIDFLNFYTQNKNIEYVKLTDFIKNHDIAFGIAFRLFVGRSRKAKHDFIDGKFIFKAEENEIHFDLCKETIEYIIRVNGSNTFTKTAKFWNVLLILFRQANFDRKQWFKNLERNISKMTPRVCEEDYISLILEIYNWASRNKIEIKDKNIDE